MYEIKGSVTFVKEEKEAKFKIIEMTDHGDREYTVKGDETVRKVLKKYA